jgi:hypothetical protein
LSEGTPRKVRAHALCWHAKRCSTSHAQDWSPSQSLKDGVKMEVVEKGLERQGCSYPMKSGSDDRPSYPKLGHSSCHTSPISSVQGVDHLRHAHNPCGCISQSSLKKQPPARVSTTRPCPRLGISLAQSRTIASRGACDRCWTWVCPGVA